MPRCHHALSIFGLVAAAGCPSGGSPNAHDGPGTTSASAASTPTPVGSEDDGGTTGAGSAGATDEGNTTQVSDEGSSDGAGTTDGEPAVAPPLEFAMGDQRLHVGDTLKNPAVPTAVLEEDYVIEYSSSDRLVVGVNGAGELTTEGSGFAIVTATLTLESGDTSMSSYATMVSFVAEAWVGQNDTTLVFEAGADDVEMYRSSAPDCDIEDVAGCPDGQSDLLVSGQTVIDTAMTSERPGFYTYVYGEARHDIPMSISAVPDVRDHRAVVWRDKIWVVGGHGAGLRSTVTSTVDGQNWITETPDGGFEGRGFHTLTVFDDRLWLSNGDDWDGEPLNDLWVSDDGVAWDPMPAPPWSARHGGRMVAFGGQLLMMGGFDTAARNDIWSSHDGMTWTLEDESAPWPSASRFSVVEFDEQLWWIGPGDGVSEVWVSADGITWSQVTDDAAFGRRIGPGVGAFEGKLWLFGGYTNGYQGDLWSSVDGATWTQEVASPGPAPRELASVMTFDERLWVVMGSGSTNFGDAWSSLDGIEWAVESSGGTFDGRWSHETVSFDGKLWVFGGWGNDVTARADAWSTTDGITWQLEAEHGFPATFTPVTPFLGELWLVGGYREDVASQAVYASADGVTWAEQPDAPFAPRIEHAAAVFDDQLWVLGGMDGAVQYGDVWRTPDGFNWEEVLDVPFGPIRGHLALVYDDTLWVIDGQTVWSYDDSGWALATGAADYGDRFGMTGLATSDGMLVIGGHDSTGLLNDVWLSTDGSEWVLVTEDAGFTPRLYAGAVLHEEQAFVIGGSHGGQFEDNANDVWRTLDMGATWRRGHRSALTF